MTAVVRRVSRLRVCFEAFGRSFFEGGEVASYACLFHRPHGLFYVVNSNFVRLVLHDVGKAQGKSH